MNASKILFSALLTLGAMVAAPSAAQACGGYGTPTVEARVARAAELELADQLEDGEWVWVSEVTLSKDGKKATAFAEFYGGDSTTRMRVHLVRDDDTWQLSRPQA